jgi:sugar (pentulose or hexulose) kinase
MTELKMLAVDLGASNGRVMLGRYDGEKLEIDPLHKFLNEPVTQNGTLYWNSDLLFKEIKNGFKKAGGNEIESISIDSWGCDFGLLDVNGELCDKPVHYRDDRTIGMMEKAFDLVPREKIYQYTGIQLMRINTLFQLFSLYINKDPILEKAKALLMTSDLYSYLLTGVKTAEFTISSTSQMYDPVLNDWAGELLSSLSIDAKLLGKITQPGEVFSELTGVYKKEFGFYNTKVVSGAGHDTASAVVSVPAMNEDFFYISSGTWSLIGVELKQPIINEKALKYNLANEGGAYGTIRLLKNVMGLWIVQECRRFWEATGHTFSFEALVKEAETAKPFRCFVDPDDELFTSPGNMPERIVDYCERTGQVKPESVGEIIRCVLESLAFKYRLILEQLEEVTEKHYDSIYIVGGGVNNKMLCRFTASATGRKVLAGPVEATVIGNMTVQAITLGEIKTVWQAREMIRNSFSQETYQPEDHDNWNDIYLTFKEKTGL